jgi:hypothetical protein
MESAVRSGQAAAREALADLGITPVPALAPDNKKVIAA